MKPLLLIAATLLLAGASMAARAKPTTTPEHIVRVVKTDAEWRKLLPASSYNVLRQEGTEIAFTGRYWDERRKGIYKCAGCGLELFDSRQKFDSGTGWPSFWQPLLKSHVIEKTDTAFGEERTAVECARCGGHLGHVFADGPPPTGLRYCINSAALEFVPAK